MKGKSAFEFGLGGPMSRMKGISAFEFGPGGQMGQMRGKNALEFSQLQLYLKKTVNRQHTAVLTVFLCHAMLPCYVAVRPCAAV
ncbi:hypothetical protein [Paenibacillus sp. FSL R7-0273]|uniref:hypothetical protein n=1 Tax=Paenibacillus sp. FSL R7-0273 TaxID=1536772 RepID=UPI00117F07CB|nr:hypothetical protein [Paenibacillus sp. FSL R7-0273]